MNHSTPVSAAVRAVSGASAWQVLRTVFVKEFRENLRDRRTLLSALLTGPLLGPLVLVMLMKIGINRQLEKAEKPLSVPVIGAEYAPNLVAALRAGGLDPAPALTDPERAVRQLDADVVIRIPADFGEHWRKGEIAEVEVIFDASQRDSKEAGQRVSEVLERFGRTQGAMRLIARGLAPEVAWPLASALRDQATAKARAALLFSVLPYFFVITVFMGGMYLAIDLTAGERERQSLEPLLINPVARTPLVLGKLAAIGAFASISLLISLAAFAVVGRWLPAEKMGMELDLGLSFAVPVALLMIPLIVLLAAAQTLVAAYARSYREAQTYVSLLMLVPMLPSLVLSLLPFKPRDWMYAVPLLSQNLGITRLLRGESVGVSLLMTSWLGTGLVAVLLVGSVIRLYRMERLAIAG